MTDQCEICGEQIGESEEAAEMYDPAWGDWQPDKPNVICHAQCGLNLGFEVA